MIPEDLIAIIVAYSRMPKLREWICVEYLDRNHLQANPLAFDAGLSSWGESMVSKYFIKNTHPDAVAKMRGQMDNGWFIMSSWSNPMLIDYLLDHPKYGPDRIVWYYLSSNSSKRAVDILLKNPEKIYPNRASANPGLIRYMLCNGTMICSTIADLCENPSDEAIAIISKFDNKAIGWRYLCRNSHPWALEKLRQNQHRIKWDVLSENPGIFVYQDAEIADVLRELRW